MNFKSWFIQVWNIAKLYKYVATFNKLFIESLNLNKSRLDGLSISLLGVFLE